MPSRRSHKKSRHGCNPCKSRKVKCDEIRPSCSRCTARQSECQYSTPFRGNHEAWSSTVLTTESSTPTGTPFTAVESPRPLLQQMLSSPPLSKTSAPDSKSTECTHEGFYQTHHLALLHHYSTSTALFLTKNREIEELWQITIPKMAFSFPFLLHCVLATSACHLTYVEDDKDGFYLKLAKNHYSTALSLVRPEIDNINAVNGPPVFAFSMLVICVSLGMPQAQDVEPQSIKEKSKAFVDYVTNSIRLIRGVRDLLDATGIHVKRTIFTSILEIRKHLAPAPFTFDAEVALKSIFARITADIQDPALQVKYFQAVTALRESNPQRDTDEAPNIVLTWPAIIPDEIFLECDAGNHVALAIIAFYGTMLDKCKDTWWIGDKGKRLVESISELLPRGWESVIVWAKMSVGLQCEFTQPGS